MTGSDARHALEALGNRLMAGSNVPIEQRFVQLAAGERLCVMESGSGAPVVLLHGTGSIGLDFIPLIEHFPGRRVIIVDRPGHGLSDPVEGLRDNLRGVAVRVITQLLDALEIDTVDLIGNSGGGFWMLYIALDQPERVRRMVSIGATPMLPGTNAPFPLKLMATPGIGQLLNLLMPKPSRRSMIKAMEMVGEPESITSQYPDLIDAWVATSRDPLSHAAATAEFKHAIAGLRGFRRPFTEAVLRSISQPLLLLWGENDPVGSSDAARRTAEYLPNAEVAILPTGHAPWLGESARCGELITAFLDTGPDSTESARAG